MSLLLNVVTYLTGEFDYTTRVPTNMYFYFSGIEFTEMRSVATSIFIFRSTHDNFEQ